MLLWTGILSKRTHALQLLLIVDYIADWARDIYRENVITRLEDLIRSPWKPKVAFPVAYTVRSLEGITVNIQSPKKPTTKTPRRAGNDCPDNMRKMRHEKYAFRDATVGQYRVLGLFITEDNIDELCDPSKPRKSTKDLLDTIAIKFEMHQAAQIPGRYLADMERSWAGQPPKLQPSKYRNKDFFVLFTFSAYFTSDWVPVREMCYIAVLESVFPRIMQDRPPKPLKRTELTKRAYEDMIRSFLNCPAYVNMRACASRCSVCPVYMGSSKRKPLINIFKAHSLRAPIWMVEDSTRKSRDFVWQLYGAHFISGIEPNKTSYIRSSELWETQDTRSQRKEHDGTPWGLGELQLSSNFALLVDSPLYKTPKGKQDYCLMVFDSKPLHDLVSRNKTLLLNEAYETTRLDFVKPWNNIKWNLKRNQIYKKDLDGLDKECIEAFKEAYETAVGNHNHSVTTTLAETLSKLDEDDEVSEDENDIGTDVDTEDADSDGDCGESIDESLHLDVNEDEISEQIPSPDSSIITDLSDITASTCMTSVVDESDHQVVELKDSRRH